METPEDFERRARAAGFDAEWIATERERFERARSKIPEATERATAAVAARIRADLERLLKLDVRPTEGGAS